MVVCTLTLVSCGGTAVDSSSPPTVPKAAPTTPPPADTTTTTEPPPPTTTTTAPLLSLSAAPRPDAGWTTEDQQAWEQHTLADWGATSFLGEVLAMADRRIPAQWALTGRERDNIFPAFGCPAGTDHLTPAAHAKNAYRVDGALLSVTARVFDNWDDPQQIMRGFFESNDAANCVLDGYRPDGSFVASTNTVVWEPQRYVAAVGEYQVPGGQSTYIGFAFVAVNDTIVFLASSSDDDPSTLYSLLTPAVHAGLVDMLPEYDDY